MSDLEAHQEHAEVGRQLRRRRQGLGLDMEEAGRECGLSIATIRTLEEEDPVEWAADTRTLASLRIYARLLDLEPEPMVSAAWRAGGTSNLSAAAPVEPLVPGPGYPHQPRRRRRLLAAAGVVAVLTVIGATVVAVAVIDGETAPPDVVLDDEPPEVSEPSTADREEAREETPPEDADEAGETPPEEETPPEDEAEAPEDDGLPGRTPQETPVQVLNALEDDQATAQAVEHLESLGYDIVLVDTTIRPWPETSVYYNPGWDTEAESLRARDERFAVGGENEVFVDDAGLHVVIGLDWTD